MSGCVSAEELCDTLNGEILEQRNVEECPEIQWNMCKKESFMNDQNTNRYKTTDGCVGVFELCNLHGGVLDQIDEPQVCQLEEWDWCYQSTDDTTMLTRWRANQGSVNCVEK
jgi:hypothetical protein